MAALMDSLLGSGLTGRAFRRQDQIVQDRDNSVETETAAGQKYNLLTDYPGFLVRRLWQIHIAMFLEEVEGSLTPIQFSILLALSQKDWLEQGRLATEVGIDRSNAADVLPRMERHGLIQRRRSTEDRRTMLVALTGTGRTTFEKWRERVDRSHDRMLEALPFRQRAVFVRMMQRIVLSKNDLGRARLTIS